MPWRWTSCGSSGIAVDSLFCTCTWAMSGSVPCSKVRLMFTMPELLLSEVMSRRLSMPLSFCSMTWVTVSSSVLASAPGYIAEMPISGGAIEGYCATGSWRMASPPASMMRMATTHAKMGRSMKNLGKSGCSALGVRVRARTDALDARTASCAEASAGGVRDLSAGHGHARRGAPSAVRRR